jgi:hypothetical protein
MEIESLQEALFDAVITQIRKVMPNGVIRCVRPKPGRVNLYIEPRGGKPFECASALSIVFYDTSFSVEYSYGSDWKSLQTADYREGKDIRALLEVAADCAVAGAA